MGDGREVAAREAQREGAKGKVPVEAVPVEPVERVQVVPASPASGRGCLALVVLGLTVGTVVWLWFRHEVVFPLDLRAQVGLVVYAEFYRDLSTIAVALIGVCWLWALRWRSDARMRSRAILATGLVTVSAIFLAWLWTQVQLWPEARDRQVKELATWATALFAIGALYRLLRR